MMKIILKSQAQEAQEQKKSILLTERLPAHLATISPVDCTYRVHLRDGFYLLSMHVRAELDILCQRCMQSFHCHYENESHIAVCDTEEGAERLMSEYECIVSIQGQVDLTEIITDELHLFMPEKHEDVMQCDVNNLNRLI